jgi:diguanylate cyclase (GGDEF)-like protein
MGLKNNLKHRLIDYESKIEPKYIWALSIILISFIGIADYYLTIDISLSIFYLMPIILITWYGGKNEGLVFALLSTISWSIGDLHAKQYPHIWLHNWNTLVRLGFFVIISYLLSALKIAYEKEKYLARNDELTDTVNRRFFLELLKLELKRCDRYNHHFTLAYLDIDNFKQINDRFGHSTGDRLLRLTTETIKNSIRNTDIIARLGGDEFALLLPESDDRSAEQVLVKIKQKLDLAMQKKRLFSHF